MRIAGAALLSSALILGLAGCSPSSSTTVPAANVAHASSAKLQKEVGSSHPPKMDCGTKDILLKVGTKVHCDVTEPSNGDIYDATVTFIKVNGLKYSVDVTVAAAPKK